MAREIGWRRLGKRLAGLLGWVGSGRAGIEAASPGLSLLLVGAALAGAWAGRLPIQGVRRGRPQGASLGGSAAER